MTKLKAILIALFAALVFAFTSGVAPAPSAVSGVSKVEAASGHLTSCVRSAGSTSTWTVCNYNDGNPNYNGLQRNQTVCFNGSAYQVKYGAWVLQYGYSNVTCSAGYWVVSGYPYIQYL